MFGGPISFADMKLRALVVLIGGLAVAAAACGSGDRPVVESPEAVAEARAEALMRFVEAPNQDTLREVGFAPEVILGLGDRVLAHRLVADLMDPAAWVLHAGPDGFRGRVRPLSALAVLAGAGETTVSLGPHRDCVNQLELPAPPQLARLARVSIRPSPQAISTCILWWSVDLFISESGEIAGLTLDLWDA